MIMQVHDELVFEVETSLVDAVSSRVKELMETAVELDVLLEVEVGVGENWDQAH
jgi:DNA polymerase-1